MTEQVVSVVGRIRNLIHERDKGNVSQAARRTGVHQTTLARIWTERTGEPGMVTLEKIAKGYSVSLHWLLTGEPSRSAPDLSESHGDGLADELVRWLDLPETRAQMDLSERILYAYRRALEQGFTAPDLAIVDAWRDVHLSRVQGVNV